MRESLVRMGTLVESQIEAALDALRRRDGSAAEKVRTQALKMTADKTARFAR